MTDQSILVSSNRFMRSCVLRSVTDTMIVVLSDVRGRFFLSKELFNLGSRKCSQWAAGSRTRSCSVSFDMMALLLIVIFYSIE